MSTFCNVREDSLKLDASLSPSVERDTHSLCKSRARDILEITDGVFRNYVILSAHDAQLLPSMYIAVLHYSEYGHLKSVPKNVSVTKPQAR